MSRQTEISDLEIDDPISTEEEERERVFQEISFALIAQKRLMKRFYYFCEEYVNFEFDESGINFDEASELKRKAEKIRDLIFHNIESMLAYNLENINSNVEQSIITMNFKTEENTYNITIEVLNNSFNLEVL